MLHVIKDFPAYSVFNLVRSGFMNKLHGSIYLRNCVAFVDEAGNVL